jgi:hypothetical protein
LGVGSWEFKKCGRCNAGLVGKSLNRDAKEEEVGQLPALQYYGRRRFRKERNMNVLISSQSGRITVRDV